VLNTHAFAFWERCTDLGSSGAVQGNSTEYYRQGLIDSARHFMGCHLTQETRVSNAFDVVLATS